MLVSLELEVLNTVTAGMMLRGESNSTHNVLCLSKTIKKHLDVMDNG